MSFTQWFKNSFCQPGNENYLDGFMDKIEAEKDQTTRLRSGLSCDEQSISFEQTAQKLQDQTRINTIKSLARSILVYQASAHTLTQTKFTSQDIKTALEKAKQIYDLTEHAEV